ncbi:PREDICTED: uncharacterized protein LOC107172316, partial [Diuraphis noxia]|uniref:uncharacterized protein LOC107172316 n=1 Tax=Diuraphis noxia TaxID=143948 RepID=UPI000763594C
ICKLEVKKEVERMKSQALSSQDNPQQIIASSQLNPVISGALSDFEMASINAFNEVFPNVKQKGCHFHFSQCIWRKIQQIQYMAQKYISDLTFSSQIRLLLALAYVPENHVIDAFEELINSLYYTDNENILQPLIDYTLKTPG